MILLDSCVISESLKPSPDPRLAAWIDSLPEESVFIPSLVIGELAKGIALLADGAKRQALTIWFEQLRQRFSGKILPIDEETALVWGGLLARLSREGRPCPAIDGLIAATALRHGATLATRNTEDFIHSGVSLINPWE